MSVDVRVILFVENDRMDEYLCLHIKMGTPRVYMRMYTMDRSTKRLTLTSLKTNEPFGPRFHFEKLWGNRRQSMRGSYSWSKVTQRVNIYVPI